MAEREVNRRYLRREDADRLIIEAAATNDFGDMPATAERERTAAQLCSP